MKALVPIAAFTLLAFSAYSGEGLPISCVLRHWSTLTSTTNFHETHSTEDMPPEVLRYILGISGSRGVQQDRNKVAEPGEPLTSGSRLVWAATDNTNWVTHYEVVSEEFVRKDLPRRTTNYCVAASFLATNGTLQTCNGGFMRGFTNYKEFITYATNHLSNP